MESNSMQVDIPAELVSFVDQEFASGRYGSREEVLIQGLHWLRDERQQAVAGIGRGSMTSPPGAPSRSLMPSLMSAGSFPSRTRNDLSGGHHPAGKG